MLDCSANKADSINKSDTITGSHDSPDFMFIEPNHDDFDEFLYEKPPVLKKSPAIKKSKSFPFSNLNYHKNPKKRKRPSPEKYCLAFLGVLYFAVVIFNLFQPVRLVVSERENRTLTEFPTYSPSSLRDGSYFDQLSLFFSDTFVFRDNLVLLSRKTDSLYGVSGDFAVLAHSGNNSGEEEDGSLGRRLEEELNKLTPTEEITEAKTDTPETVPEAQPLSVSLSHTEIKLPIGSTAAVDFSLSGGDGNEQMASVFVSNDMISAAISGQSIIIGGNSEGTATFTVNCGNASAVCIVTVTSVAISENNGEADFLADGMFIYNGAVYTISGYGQKSVGYLSKCLDYYKSLFENTRVSVLPAPVSSVLIDNPEITDRFTSQKYILDSMQSRMTPNINFVNTYDEIFSHRTEYLYFKSDHHWTQLGAYYAYRAFASSAGFTPTPLQNMNHSVINDAFNGSMYNFTGDERVKNFIDQVEVHYPTKSVTMTITRQDGKTVTYDRLILSEDKNYLAFIAGDNPYTVINVPDNPPDLSILVMKDSYGNAFIPFLAEHYGNIIVIDPRYCDINVYDQFKDYGFTDILFIGNIQSLNNMKWSKYFFACVGIDLDSLG